MLSKDIEVVPVRDLLYEDAQKEVIGYLKKAGKRSGKAKGRTDRQKGSFSDPEGRRTPGLVNKQL